MLLQKILLDWSSPLDNGRNDIVFENRNKAYGAYTIRRDYDQVLLFSVLAATGILVSLICTQFLFKNEVISKHTIDTGPILIEKLITIEKEKPILDPIKKIEPPKEALTKPAAPIKGVNMNNVEIDDHSKVNTNVPIVPDANANPNATNTNTEITPPTKLPEINTGGTGGTGGAGNTNSNEINLAPDIMPSFIGGEEALAKFFKKQVVYPRISIERDEESKVFVKFVVEKDGSIGLAEVVKGGKYAALNKEALRVVNSMPKWNPGMSGGKPARVYFYVPINFVLAES